jgi:hypothetical protein
MSWIQATDHHEIKSFKIFFADFFVLADLNYTTSLLNSKGSIPKRKASLSTLESSCYSFAFIRLSKLFMKPAPFALTLPTKSDNTLKQQLYWCSYIDQTASSKTS